MSSWRKSATACKRSGDALFPSERLGVKSNVAIDDICSTGFMSNSNPALSLMLCMNFSRLERWRPKSANIEARLSDRLYMVMATKINGGEAPLTNVPAGCIEPDREFYDIQIRGDEQFTKGAQEALDLLQARAPDF